MDSSPVASLVCRSSQSEGGSRRPPRSGRAVARPGVVRPFNASVYNSADGYDHVVRVKPLDTNVSLLYNTELSKIPSAFCLQTLYSPFPPRVLRGVLGKGAGGLGRRGQRHDRRNHPPRSVNRIRMTVYVGQVCNTTKYPLNPSVVVGYRTPAGLGITSQAGHSFGVRWLATALAV
jgi:hypothetical protein